jgi:hypothetical protein
VSVRGCPCFWLVCGVVRRGGIHLYKRDPQGAWYCTLAMHRPIEMFVLFNMILLAIVLICLRFTYGDVEDQENLPSVVCYIFVFIN